ncbi:MAG: hypothetical protein WBV22_00400 [Anaerolineaceae bacterium]
MHQERWCVRAAGHDLPDPGLSRVTTRDYPAIRTLQERMQSRVRLHSAGMLSWILEVDDKGCYKPLLCIDKQRKRTKKYGAFAQPAMTCPSWVFPSHYPRSSGNTPFEGWRTPQERLYNHHRSYFGGGCQHD